ncbi:copper resistance protein B [Solimonas marina]|nr:copper resistance protein B [Solimonas marina]
MKPANKNLTQMLAAALATAIAAPALAAGDHMAGMLGTVPPIHTDPTVGYAALNQNEWRGGDGSNTYRWDGEAWYGSSFNRLWLKTEGSLDTDTGTLDDTEAQALLSHAISPFFDLQAGVRYDIKTAPSRGWATLGFEGLAPMFWDLGAYLYASDAGHYGARLEGSYDLYLTQRLVLQPQFELNAYAKRDARRGQGSGLSDLDAGLRLRYEIRREFAPYIGLSYERLYGDTGRYARADGEDSSKLLFVAGIRLWL